LHRVPERFAAALWLDYEIEQLEPLLFLLRRMLETVCARLAAVFGAASELVLRLGFAGGAVETMELRVPDPSGDAELLFRLLHTRLEAFRAASPVVSVELEAVLGRAVSEQRSLFDPGLRDPKRFAGTVGRLEALLGREGVGIARLRCTHRPDAVEMGIPFGCGEAGTRTQTERCAEDAGEPWPCLERSLGLPLRRFRPPLPLRVISRRGADGEEPVELASGEIAGWVLGFRGPYRISGDWWEREGGWEREEWDVEIDGGQAGLYRLLRERRCWMLEGVYG
jgi:protein ImuB